MDKLHRDDIKAQKACMTTRYYIADRKFNSSSINEWRTKVGNLPDFSLSKPCIHSAFGEPIITSLASSGGIRTHNILVNDAGVLTNSTAEITPGSPVIREDHSRLPIGMFPSPLTLNELFPGLVQPLFVNLVHCVTRRGIPDPRTLHPHSPEAGPVTPIDVVHPAGSDVAVTDDVFPSDDVVVGEPEEFPTVDDNLEALIIDEGPKSRHTL